ncbi:PP2C family protein-serine/threonine phosphatase [Nocardioides jishulii]|uniref:Serine/threonine-protein phosphatase n=1 Tax=Nocardioides jishulii TaxID=2575440 RepID=A0A4U2YMX9_9ACTN|nr:PP2C family protein-serine/threonine phosphatase [Nocardioides jishulii]QCX27839.1 serine/threonine-protein phosphatase [Nocardioides jishulii]TKI62646.1 serine/threonine-protein phosphatase [Nocardioides jishulii]
MDEGLETLEALVPASLGLFPSLCVTGRYVLGRHRRCHSASGLKAVPLPDGRVAVAVAEAPGGGAVAAVTTARLFAVLYARLEDGASLSDALAGCDRCARRTPQGPGATMAVAVVAQDDGITEVGTAGHTAPLHLTRTGRTRHLPLPASRPLGTGGVPTTAELHLEIGDSLVLYTKGLVTARDGLVATGTRRLEALLTEIDPMRCADGDAVAEDVLGAMQRPSGFVDDVALVVAQRCSPPTPFRFTGHVAPGERSRCTTALSDWLAALGVSLVDHVTLQRAVDVIATSIVDSHATRTRAAFTVDAVLTDGGVVEIRLRCTTSWRPETPGRQHALVVAGGLVDSLRLSHTTASPNEDQVEHGTQVLLRQAVGRAVPLLRSVAHDSTGRLLEAASGPSAMVRETVPGSLWVTGAMGTEDEEEFRWALHEVTCSGTVSATIDLTGITRMTGHAVLTLFDFLERAASSQVDLTVVADEDSVADQVLTLAALPHVTH